ncbi:phage protein GemA/Gp16 family protein [Escherichia coli]
MNRTSLIKLIHVARRELQLDDDTYRAFLMQKTGKISCRELTVTQLEQVLDAMKERGFKKLNKHPRRRFKGHVTPREKVYKVWQQMAEDGFITDGGDVALDKYVQRLTAKRNGGQAAAGVDDDGIVGKNTRAAVLRADTDWLLLQCFLRRSRYYAGIIKSSASQGKYLNGWFNRLDLLASACREVLHG